MLSKVKSGWKNSSLRYAETDWFWRRTAGCYVLLKQYKPLLAKYAQGRLLDAGAGTLCCRPLCVPHVREYVSVDVGKFHEDLTRVGDVQDLPFEDSEFDTAISFQVLEHVADPHAAVSEMARVLKPGGIALISVPLLGYLHNEPDDYWRYTKHGMKVLADKYGFEVVSIEPLGGLCSFFHHLFFTALTGLTYGIPLVEQLTMQIARLTGEVAMWLDPIIDYRRLLPMYYMAVFRKKST